MPPMGSGAVAPAISTPVMGSGASAPAISTPVVGSGADPPATSWLLVGMSSDSLPPSSIMGANTRAALASWRWSQGRVLLGKKVEVTGFAFSQSQATSSTGGQLSGLCKST